jgi:hypothetical protein
MFRGSLEEQVGEGMGSDRQTVMIGGIIQARNDNVPLPRVKLRGGSATKPMASTLIVKPSAQGFALLPA